MKYNNLRFLYTTFSILIIISTYFSFKFHNSDIASEPYFALALLNNDNVAANYFSNNVQTISVNEKINWIIYLHNNMADIKFVSIKVKLLNSTINPPNETLCIPSPAPVLFDKSYVIKNNETWLYPFELSIVEINTVNDYLQLTSIFINNEKIYSGIISKYGYNFRLVFELWVYDHDLDNFTFNWEKGSEMRCTWNQIWFNATITN